MLNKLYIHTKMKRNLSFILICSGALLLASCSKQEYYNVPVDANGRAIITSVSTGTNTGITSLDNSLTVVAKLPNAKAGDSFTAEIVKSQTPTGGGAAQNLPLAGSKKTVTVAADLTATVTYTKAETALNLGESIVVTFSGATDSYTSPQITLTTATTVGTLNFANKATTAVKGAGSANLPVTVAPKGSTYAGTITVSTSDSEAGPYTVAYTPVGSTFNIPVDASTFGSTGVRYYKIQATLNGVTETVISRVVAQESFFFLKKTTGILSLATSGQSGFNLTTGASVDGSVTDATKTRAQLVVNSNSLVIKAGPAITGVTGNSLFFVASTVADYNANNAIAAKAAYAAGTPTTTADGSTGSGVFIYKMVLGPLSTDVYYGYIKITTVVPGVSSAFEYLIGDQYAHLAVIQ
jgi:hypothetical protein